MKFAVYGIGAAGNKAAINLMEKCIISESNIKLMNTTTKDIPEKYKKNGNLVFNFGSEIGGCGKEATKGRRAMIEAINRREHDIVDIIPEDPDRQAIIITSTEGGTGSGATPALANYLSENFDMPVHVFAFTGFNDDPRGIKNTLLFLKNLTDNIVLHTIKNDEFLDKYTNNHELAELKANDYLAEQITVLCGLKMIPSDQNIDNTDMYKTTTTSGYMDIKHIDLTGVKTIDAFDKTIIDAYENNSKGLGFEPSAKRIGVFINASEKTRLAIDGNFSTIKRYVGESFAEFFKHIQYDNTTEEYIDIIAGGLEFPKEEIININKKYTEVKEKMNTSRESLKSIFDNIDGLDDDDEFDVDISSKKKAMAQSKNVKVDKIDQY